MSLSAKIAQNTLIQAVGKVLGLALALLAAGMTLRYLKDDGFGAYTTVLAFLQMFGIIIDLGLYIILIKRLATLPTDAEHLPQRSKVADTIFSLRLLTGVLVLGSAPAAAWILSLYNDNYSTEVLLGITLTTFFYLFLSLNQLLSAIFQKFLDTRWVALGEVIGKVVQLVLTLAVIFFGGSVVWMLLVLVASAGINFLINWVASRKYIRLNIHIDWSIAKSVLKDAWPIALSIAFTLIYFKGDTLIMTLFEEDRSIIGQYGAPYKILEVLVTFPAMFAGLALPVLTAAWQERQHERFQSLFQRSFAALAIMAIPMIAGVQVLAPQMMTLIAGNEFASDAAGFQRTIDVLRILIVATTAIYFGTLFGYLVVSLNKQKTMLFVYGFVAVTALLGYTLLIPRFSVYGAAWVTVYSETMVAVAGLAIILWTTRTRLSAYPFIASLLASYAMFIVLSAALPLARFWNTLPETMAAGVTLLVFVPIGAVVYGLATLGLRAISLSEIKSLLKRSSV